MALELVTSDILSERELYALDNELVHQAVYLALLGAIDHARELISLLFRHGSVRPDSPVTAGKLLLFAWIHTGQYPDEWPKSIVEETEVETSRDHWQNELLDLQTGDHRIPPEALVYDQKGLDHCLKFISEAEPRLRFLLLPRALDMSLAVHQPGPDVQTLSELDEQTAGVLRDIAKIWPKSTRIPSNGYIHGLTDCERAWPLYARGILAEALGLDEYTVRKRAARIVAAFQERIINGMSSVHASPSIPKLLETANRNTTHPLSPGKVDEFFENPKAYHDPVTSLYQQPATSQEIADVETRLGVQLPDDYKAFLQCSNGFGLKSSNTGIFQGHFPGAEIFDLDRVQWSDMEFSMSLAGEFDSGTLSEFSSNEELLQAATGGLSWREFSSSFCFGRVIVVGSGPHGGQLFLVPPHTMRRIIEQYMNFYELGSEPTRRALRRWIDAFAGSIEEFQNIEWALFEQSNVFVQGYLSFKYWLRDQVSRSFGFPGWD